jgi:hypothetical protein
VARAKSKLTQLEEIAELRRQVQNDPEIVHRVHLGQCATFVRCAIATARDMAKCNKKDAARDWYRFLLNSKLLDILDHEGALDNVSQLRSELSCLGSECHPLEVPDYSCDLEAIRAQLRDIRGCTEELLRRTGGPALGVVNA